MSDAIIHADHHILGSSRLAPHWMCPHPTQAGLRPILAIGLIALWVGGIAGCARSTPEPTPLPSATPSPSITPTPSATFTPSPSPTPTFPSDALVRIDALNLRAGPDTLHPIVDVILRRTPVAIEGRDDSDTWYAVRLKNGNRGWISSDYVSLRRDADTIPTAITPTPPPTPTPTPIPMDPSLPLIAVPPVVAQGDPFLIRVRAEEAQQVVAAFDGLDVHLQALGGGRFATLLAAGLETNPGQQPVHLSIIDQGGNVRNERLDIGIRSGGYGVERIQLSEELMATLDAEAAEAETARLAELWAPVSPEQLALGRWTEPVTGTVSSPFGGIRDFNQGFLQSRHFGLDLRGSTGTPIRAPARGRVVLAEPLQIRGGCIWLDHGWGVYSGYFHLSKIDVAAGDLVEQGALLGAVGSTGRSTAPHLHWEMRVRGRAASPIQWLARDVGFVP